MRRARILWCAVWTLAMAGPVAGVDTRPVGVSPGSASGTRIADPCPTFSWGPAEGATRHVLAVYEVDGDRFAREALRHRIPVAALSWTPPLDRCLLAGRRYAWTVAAVGAEGAQAWSEPLLFEVSKEPTAQELRRALAVVRRYYETTGADGDKALDLKDPEEAAPGGAGEPAESIESAPMTPGAELQVDGEVAATSFSGNGSGLTNVNATFALNAGQLSGQNASSYLRSDTTDVFTGNELTLASGTTLDVDGNLQLPTSGISGAGPGSGLNADRLDGISSGTFLTESEGADLIRAHEVADHVKIVFVTGLLFNGDLGGRAGGDQKCQTEANGADLPGTYKAWLSGISNTDEARDVLRHFPGDYVLPDNSVVANGWADLTNGNIDRPINMMANGTTIVPPQETCVWTGTATNGARAGSQSSCGTLGQGWIVSDQFTDGEQGTITSTVSSWTDGGSPTCNNTCRLYCFQQ